MMINLCVKNLYLIKLAPEVLASRQPKALRCKAGTVYMALFRCLNQEPGTSLEDTSTCSVIVYFVNLYGAGVITGWTVVNECHS